MGGPLNIPHIYHGGSKTFYFINYNGKRAENPFDQFSTVPTLLERQGNFSGSHIHFRSRKPDNRWRFSIPPPTLLILATFRITRKRVPQINPGVRRDCCNIFRCPNLPGNFQNFHFVTSATSNSDDLNIRLNRTFGAAPAGGRRGGGRNAPRNNLSFGFHYHGSSANLTNPFPSVGGNTISPQL